jgi:hypothetical protein
MRRLLHRRILLHLRTLRREIRWLRIGRDQARRHRGDRDG